MRDGKKGLAESILRQALARAEASAHRPGSRCSTQALRNATPIIEVKPRRVGGATDQVPVEIRGTAACRWVSAGSSTARRRSASR